jgi:predicted transcriptional regulator
MRFDYDELLRLIKYKFDSVNEFAKQIGMPEYSLYNRLKGRTGFKQSEIWLIMDKLEIPDSEMARYFFTVRDSKCED